MMLSIKIDENTKKALDAMKVIPRETISSVIDRLISAHKEPAVARRKKVLR